MARHVQNIEARVNEGCSTRRSASGNGKQAQGAQNCSSKAMIEFSLAPKVEMHTITNVYIARRALKTSMVPEMSIRHGL